MTQANNTMSIAEERMRFTVENGESVRLDVYLAAETEYSRSYIKKLTEDGQVLVNGSECKCSRILKENDVVEMDIVERSGPSVIAKNIPLDIIYEDDDIVVVNKQAGLTVHPGAGNSEDTLVGALVWRGTALSDVNGSCRLGIVHRLDKDTTGVMVVAKNNKAHAALASQFEKRSAVKLYVALLEGNLKDDTGMITTFIGRSEKDRRIMAVTREGRVAVTQYKVLRRFERNCLTEFNLHTGRTHQIRVHAKFLGHPVVGDKTYGSDSKRFSSLPGQLLHSKSLTITHPTSGERMTFTAPVPEIFAKTLETVEKESGGKNAFQV